MPRTAAPLPTIRQIWPFTRPYPAPWRKSRVDPFVTRAEHALAPLRSAHLPDPAAERARAGADDERVTAALDLERPDVATAEHEVEVPGKPATRVRVYWPNAKPPTPRDRPLPALVYFYGGSWTLGSIDWAGWDLTFRTRARDAGVIVVAGEYSLAPETTWPTQPAQCEAILRWAHAHLPELGGDPDALAIGGASSGGNLAAVTALRNRDRGRRSGDAVPLRLQLLEAPALDLTGTYLDRVGLPFPLPVAALRVAISPLVRRYLGDHSPTALRHSSVSPLRARDLTELPPTVIYTGEMDVLRGHGEAYARALGAAGVPATAVRYVGATHTSAGLRGQIPAADHLHRDVVATLAALHRPAPDYDHAHQRLAARTSATASPR